MSQEPVSGGRFYVFIDKKAKAVFTEVSGLQIETELMEVQEGGNNEFIWHLPGRTRVSNLTLRWGLTRSNELFKWYIDSLRGKASRKNISIVLYDPSGEEITRWDFINAFPVKWIGPELNAGNHGLAIETLEIAHEGLGEAS